MDTSPFVALLSALRGRGPYGIAWPALVICAVASAFSDTSPPWALAAWSAAAGAALADAENEHHFGPKVYAASRCAWIQWTAFAIATAHAARSSIAKRRPDRPALACAAGSLSMAIGGGDGASAAAGFLIPLADGRPFSMARAACWTAAWMVPSVYSGWLLVGSEVAARIASAVR